MGCSASTASPEFSVPEETKLAPRAPAEGWSASTPCPEFSDAEETKLSPRAPAEGGTCVPCELGMHIGRGYDTVTGVTKAQALHFNAEDADTELLHRTPLAANRSRDITKVFSSVTEASRYSAQKAKASASFMNIGFGAALNRAVESNVQVDESFAVRYLQLWTKEHYMSSATRAKLTKALESTAVGLSPEQFQAKYGDSVVVGFVTGRQLLLSRCFRDSSASRDWELGGKVNARVLGLWPGTAGVEVGAVERKSDSLDKEQAEVASEPAGLSDSATEALALADSPEAVKAAFDMSSDEAAEKIIAVLEPMANFISIPDDSNRRDNWKPVIECQKKLLCCVDRFLKDGTKHDPNGVQGRAAEALQSLQKLQTAAAIVAAVRANPELKEIGTKLVEEAHSLKDKEVKPPHELAGRISEQPFKMGYPGGHDDLAFPWQVEKVGVGAFRGHVHAWLHNNTIMQTQKCSVSADDTLGFLVRANDRVKFGDWHCYDFSFWATSKSGTRFKLHFGGRYGGGYHRLAITRAGQAEKATAKYVSEKLKPKFCIDAYPGKGFKVELKFRLSSIGVEVLMGDLRMVGC